ncbi:phosphatase PAP2 family protein [Sediminitomix flava]|uniref:Undecaprenyl-diphosphatase n=1 Tax=Sediminitomix flava TaxID=379075 RepID=A0A315Z795_SEDFL|nr:phosphatase PAP2 family protein [Sediminitomix flava]PWJ39285.1 undecaprenyl-diphosphatase [Sediminitomix flava]
MLEQLKQLDTELLIFLNGFHNETSDQIMFFVSESKTWIPLYALIIIGLWWKYGWKTMLACVLIMGAGVGLADYIASGIFKPYFARFRPSQDPELKEFVHIVNNYRGGKYGFASSHASTTFALATSIWLLLRKNHVWIFLFFFWAAFVAYSRIALGVHYPGDIIVGALIGVFSAQVAYRLGYFIDSKYANGTLKELK